MLLGAVIADGFIAVEAKDKDKVDEIGKAGHRAGRRAERGQQSVMSHCNAIIEAAKNGEWTAVRTELDKAQNSVHDAMDKLHSQRQLRTHFHRRLAARHRGA